MSEQQERHPTGRVERYRVYARIALARAQSATSQEVKESFLRIAAGWQEMADQAEMLDKSR